MKLGRKKQKLGKRRKNQTLYVSILMKFGCSGQLANRKDNRRRQRILSVENGSPRAKEIPPRLQMRRSQSQMKTQHQNRRRIKSVSHSPKSNIRSCLSIYMLGYAILLLRPRFAKHMAMQMTKSNSAKEYRSM